MVLHRKNSFLLVPFLLLVVAIGIWGWKKYQQTHVKTEIEIVQYYPESNSALAAIVENGELFTFSFPNNDKGLATGADLTQTGTLLTLTGGDYWLLSYPMQYPYVSDAEYNGKREDFVEKYFDTLVQQHQHSSREVLQEAIDQLPNLNEGEKEGLAYLVMSELQIW